MNTTHYNFKTRMDESAIQNAIKFNTYVKTSAIQNAINGLSDTLEEMRLRDLCRMDWTPQNFGRTAWTKQARCHEIAMPPGDVSSLLKTVKKSGMATVVLRKSDKTLTTFIIVPGEKPNCFHAAEARDGLTITINAATYRAYATKRRKVTLEVTDAGEVWLADAHPLKNLLPDALKLDRHAIQTLNKLLPGVVYEMPIIREEIIRQSRVALHSPDNRKARTARDWLASIACPMGRSTKHPARTRRILRPMNLIYSDFVLLRTIYKRECGTVHPDEVMRAMRKMFADVPPKYLDRVCRTSDKLTALAADALGDMIHAKGRGLRAQWEKDFAGYAGRIRTDAVARAAKIALPT